PRIPVLSLLELGVQLARLERLATKVTLADPLAGRGGAWDKESLADWLDAHVKTVAARDMITLAAQMVFAAEPREISFLYFLMYARSGGGLRRLAEIRRGAQERRFVGGAQQLSVKLAAGLDVRLSRPVRAIE